MIKNCDNCKNQDNSKPMQDCNTFGYPLFDDCENWKPKDEPVEEELKQDEKARRMCWR
jgi:hypothetical protein